jgi:hypothetical protein
VTLLGNRPIEVAQNVTIVFRLLDAQTTRRTDGFEPIRDKFTARRTRALMLVLQQTLQCRNQIGSSRGFQDEPVDSYQPGDCGGLRCVFNGKEDDFG